MYVSSSIYRISAATRARRPRSPHFAALRELLLGVAALTFTALPPTARAQTTTTESEVLDFTDLGSGFNYKQGTYSLGWRFTANQDVTVTALGFYDSLKDGLTDAHPVGIFDAETQQLLVTATVQPSDPLTGFFRYKEVTPVVLAGGKDYYIAAVTLSEEYAVNPTTLNVDPAITFDGFAAYGGTYGPNVTTLQCPSVYVPNTYHGDFGPVLQAQERPGSPGRRPGRAHFQESHRHPHAQRRSGLGVYSAEGHQIASLGYYDDSQGNFTQSHPVAVWDAVLKTAVIPEVLVTNGDPLRGFFRYHTISPITLLANHPYFIMGVSGSDPYATQVKKLNVNPRLTYMGAVYNGDTTLTVPAFPDHVDGGPGFFGPNFETAATTGQYVIATVDNATINRAAKQKATITLTRSGTTDLTRDVVVRYMVTTSLTAGTDFKALTGTKTIKAGSQTAKIKIKPVAGGADGKVSITIDPTTDYDPSTPATITIKITD